MASQLTIPQMIQVGEVSAPLAALFTDKKALFGGSVINPVPPLQITIITDFLKWGYDGGAETDATLRNIANYGYWMWGRFQLQAQNIISGPGGGSVAPTPSGGAAVNDLDFIVSASSIIATGELGVYFNGTNGNPDFRGMNVNFARGGTTQYTTNPGTGELFYGWNKVTGFFQLLGTSAEAAEGERFRIMPDTGIAGTSAGSDTATDFPYIITSANFEADGVSYNDPRVIGMNVSLQINNFTGNFLSTGNGITSTATGFIITDAAFDANSFDYTIQVNKLNS